MSEVIAAPHDKATLLAMAQADYDPARVEIIDAAIQLMPWPTKIPPMVIELPPEVGASREGALLFLLLMTSINHRFWRPIPDGIERYQHAGLTGARALWSAFSAAWGPSSRPEQFISHLSAEGVTGIFGDIPDADGRMHILEEILIREPLEFCVDLVNVIDAHSRVDVGTARDIALCFPRGFGDPYLKKAQLLLAMYAAHLRTTGQVLDVAGLTAFADYQVPRVLRALGVLRYSAPLGEAVEYCRMLPAGGPDERAIRGATLLACEAIARHLGTDAARIDNALWQMQDMAAYSRFHLTVTDWY